MIVSIALATYNGERFLEEQLDSFVAQTRPPDEVVVCDDGSSDRTIEILERFRNIAPFAVRIERNASNLGYSANFAKAVGLCSGDVIFLSDQDDYWFETKIQSHLSLYRDRPNLMAVINNQIPTSETLQPGKSNSLQNIKIAGKTSDGFITGCCTSLRSEWAEAILPAPDSFGHDTWINRLAVLFKARTLIEEPLQYHRRHGSTSSSSVENKAGWAGLVGGVGSWFRYDERAQRRTELRTEQLIDFLIRAGDQLDSLPLAVTARTALAGLQDYRDSYGQRHEMRALGFLPRTRAVIWCYLHGGYTSHRGILTAAKDIFIK